MLLLSFFAWQLSATAPDYWRCLGENAARLERSGERPRDVATAVIEACRSKEPSFGTNVRPKAIELVADKVTAQVVEIRACAKRQGCAAAPW